MERYYPTRGTCRVFFVGAGISVNPPTEFPVARSLTSDILTCLALHNGAEALLHELSDSDRTTKINAGDYLRFEMLLEAIQEIADSEMEILGFIDLFKRPNPLHMLLARRALAGDLVVTTNFDSLIEEAVISLGGQPFTVCSVEDFSYWTNRTTEGPTPIFKIHGSRLRYDGTSVSDAAWTVQATLSAVTAGCSDMMLPIEKRQWLINARRNRWVIIAGYSGGDDLDIIPTFALLKPCAIHWIFHQNDGGYGHDITEKIRNDLVKRDLWQLGSRDRYFQNLFTVGGDVLQIVEANTAMYLAELCDECPPVMPVVMESGRRMVKEFLRIWSERKMGTNHVKHSLVGNILMRLSRFREAFQRFILAAQEMSSSAEPSDQAHVAFLVSRAAVEIGKFTEAEEWSVRSLECGIDKLPPRIAALCLNQYAYAQYKLGRLETAVPAYEKAEEFCRREDRLGDLAVALHDLSLIRQEQGGYKKALAGFEESIDLSAKDGDIRHVGFSSHQIGNIYSELGKFERAEEFYRRTEDIARTIGDSALLSNVQHDQGLVDFMRGRLVEAMKRFRQSLQIDGKTSREEFVPMHHQHIGIVFMEVEKWSKAWRYFELAKEGYKRARDVATMAELQAYYAEYYLRQGNPDRAIGCGLEAIARAKDTGWPNYLARGLFVTGMAKCLSNQMEEGRDLISESICYATKNEMGALRLDLAFLLALIVGSSLFAEHEAIFEWAEKRYEELGNLTRAAVISKARVGKE